MRTIVIAVGLTLSSWAQGQSSPVEPPDTKYELPLPHVLSGEVKHTEITALMNAGGMASRAGRLAEAYDDYKRALTLMDQLGDLGAKADIQKDLGDVAKDLRLPEAPSWYQSALDTARTAPEKDESWVAMTKGELATALLNVGQAPNAEGVAKEALTELQSSRGRTDFSVITTLRVLTLIYLNENKISDAQSSAESYLGLARRVLGETHFEVARAHGLLGIALARANRTAEARSELETSLALWQKYPNPPAQDIVMVGEPLLDAMLAAKQVGGAETLSRRILDAAQRGGMLEDAAQAAQSLATLVFQKSDFVEARDLCALALKFREKPGRPNDQFDAHLLSLMGTSEYDLEEYEPAERHLRQALELHRKVNGGNTADAVDDAVNLMQVLGKSQRYVEAIKLGNEAVQAEERARKPGDVWIADTREKFAWQLFKAGHQPEGREQIRLAMALRQKLEGASALSVGSDLFWLGQSFSRSGLLPAATNVTQRALAIALARDSKPDVADDALLLGFILGRRGAQFAGEAERRYRQSLEIRRRGGGVLNLAQVELAFAAYLLNHAGPAEAESLLRDAHDRTMPYAVAVPYTAAAAQSLAQIATQHDETKEAKQWSDEVEGYCHASSGSALSPACETILGAHVRCGVPEPDPLDCTPPTLPGSARTPMAASAVERFPLKNADAVSIFAAHE